MRQSGSGVLQMRRWLTAATVWCLLSYGSAFAAEKAILVLDSESMKDMHEGPCEMRFASIPRMTPEQMSSKLRDGYFTGATAGEKAEGVRVGNLLRDGKVEFCTVPQAREVLRGILDIMKERELPKDSSIPLSSMVESIAESPLTMDEVSGILNREIAGPTAHDAYKARLRGILVSFSFARQAAAGSGKAEPIRKPLK